MRTFLYQDETIDFSDTHLSPDELARYVEEHERNLTLEKHRHAQRMKAAHCGFKGGFI